MCALDKSPHECLSSCSQFRHDALGMGDHSNGPNRRNSGGEGEEKLHRTHVGPPGPKHERRIRGDAQGDPGVHAGENQKLRRRPVLHLDPQIVRCQQIQNRGALVRGKNVLWSAERGDPGG